MAGGASVAEIERRLAEIRERIVAAGGALDRVTIVGVTKASPPDLTARAVAAGLVDLGENYAQELVTKIDDIGSAATVRWHFIGGLQRNKVKLLAGRVHLWHTVDRRSLVAEIAKRSPGDRVLIQVNTTGEPQKSGCDPADVTSLVDEARRHELDVRGLMTVGPTSADVDPRPSFERLRRLARAERLSELSMGMSGDYEAAVAEGATIVRIGSSLFGTRPPRTDVTTLDGRGAT